MSSFDIFWTTYPRRAGKGAASKAWDKALSRGVAPEDIIEGARRYSEDPDRKRKDPTFTAHPSTWLNQDRWLDEPVLSSVPVPVDLVERWKDNPNRDYPTALTLFPHIKKVEAKHKCIYCRSTKPSVFDKVLEGTL